MAARTGIRAKRKGTPRARDRKEDAGSLYIRGANAESVAQAKAAAGARGWTLAEYVSAMILALRDVQQLAVGFVDGVGDLGTDESRTLVRELLAKYGLDGRLV